MADGDSISGCSPTAVSKFIAFWFWPSPRTEELRSNLTDEQLDFKFESFLQGMNVMCLAGLKEGVNSLESLWTSKFTNWHWRYGRYGPQRPLLTTFPRSASIILYTCRCFFTWTMHICSNESIWNRRRYCIVHALLRKHAVLLITRCMYILPCEGLWPYFLFNLFP